MSEIIDAISVNIINPVIGLMFVLAFLVFLWGVFTFITNTDDETNKKKGKNNLIYGVLGMAIMVSVFGIIKFIKSSIGLV